MSKFEFEKGKMVPYPSRAIVPDRDVNETPALECIHLGIEFGGLKAVDDFNLTIGKTEMPVLLVPTVLARPRYSTCLPRSISPQTELFCSTAKIRAARP